MLRLLVVVPIPDYEILGKAAKQREVKKSAIESFAKLVSIVTSGRSGAINRGVERNCGLSFGDLWQFKVAQLREHRSWTA
jgi:hypothetical protein